MRGLYKVLKGLIDPAEASRIAERIRNEPEGKPDPQVPGSAAHYGLPVCNTLLGLLCSKVSEAAGLELRPTYSYCRVYREGNDLKPHKDRPSCEYSVTLNLSALLTTGAGTMWEFDGIHYDAEVGNAAVSDGKLKLRLNGEAAYLLEF